MEASDSTVATGGPRPTIVFVGLTCVDLIASVESFPEEDTEVRASGLRRAVGGNATNSSQVAALLGFDVVLVAPFAEKTLNDPSTAFAINSLLARSIKVVPDFVPAPIPTSLITVAADSGSRTIVSCKQPGYRNVRAATFTDAIRNSPMRATATGTESALNCKWIHFEGRDGSDLHGCINFARQHRADSSQRYRISLELEKASEGRLESLMMLAPMVDVLLVSSEFAQALGFSTAASCATSLASKLQKGGIVACAFGSSTAAAAQNVGDSKCVVFEEKPDEIVVVDSVGAGDSFNAAFIGALFLEATTKEALRGAVNVATEKCKRRFDAACRPCSYCCA